MNRFFTGPVSKGMGKGDGAHDDASVRAPFEFRGHRLDEFQIQAIIALQQETATLVSAPTGTGKSLIADYLVDESLKSGRRVVYTAPIKALVNQKYRGFRAAFGAARTGIMTGDLSENADAPMVVMTTEVLRNMLLHGGPNDGGPKGGGPKGGAPLPDWIVFDEIHYINHPERGTVWEEAILLLPKGVRILGLSATVPNIREPQCWSGAEWWLPSSTTSGPCRCACTTSPTTAAPSRMPKRGSTSRAAT